MFSSFKSKCRNYSGDAFHSGNTYLLYVAASLVLSRLYYYTPDDTLNNLGLASLIALAVRYVPVWFLSLSQVTSSLRFELTSQS